MTFLIETGYKKPIQNMEELYESGMKLYYPVFFKFVFENGEETDVLKVKRNSVNCRNYSVCFDWAKYHKNVSILYDDIQFKVYCADGDMLDENSKLLMCKLEDGIFYTDGLSMLMLQGDPLMRRVTEVIDRVIEAGIYNHWLSLFFNIRKLRSGKIGLIHTLDGYYSFNLYHMQPAFYLLLMGLCLSVLCFMVEFLYNYVFSKRK
jgi:hypothetical protein